MMTPPRPIHDDAMRRKHVTATTALRAYAVRAFSTLIACVAVLAVQVSPALAKGKTIAICVEGPDSDAIHKLIAGALPHGASAADDRAFHDALAEQGARQPFGRSLDAGREKTLARVRKAAAAAGVDATVIVRVTTSRKERKVQLLVVATSGAAGDLEDEITLGLKPNKEDDEKVATSVGTALVDYRGTPDRAAPSETAKPAAPAETAKPAPSAKEAPPPPAAAPTAEEQPPKNEPSAAETVAGNEEPAPDQTPQQQRAHGVFGHNLFELALGAGGMGRHFGYSVDSNSSLNLRPYTVLPAALVSLTGELYPLADARNRILRDFGLIGGYARTLFLQSSLDGGAIDTTESTYVGGIKWRVLPAGDGGIVVGVSLSYVSQSFGFGATSTPDLPSVSYRAVRPGVDVRIPIGVVALFAGAGYRGVLQSGDVGQRFHGTVTTGLDFGAGVGVAIARGWEVRLAGDYERYMYSFSPVYNPSTMLGDVYRANGAIDNFYTGQVAIASVY